MTRKVSLLFILLLTSLLVRAQDDILRLSIDDIGENQMLISNASAADYWKFHTGHNPKWSAANLDDSSWDTITPITLALDMVDEDGILEGWFRLKFELDPSLDSVPLFFHVRDFGQALDVYLNGKIFHRHGQMGNDTIPFQGAVASDIYTFIPAMLASDSIYSIAIHYKHLPLRFPANMNEVDGNLHFGFWLVTNSSMLWWRENLVRLLSNGLFCTTAIGVITFLVWLFFLYNRNDNAILLISLCVTGFFFLEAYTMLDSAAFSLSLSFYNTARLISQLSVGLIMGLIPLIFAKIFTGTIPRLLWVVIPLVFFRSITPMIGINEQSLGLNIFTALLFISIATICVYYVIKAWKHLKRPQWAVVIGMLLFLLCAFITSSLLIYFPDILASQFANLIARNFGILSFPFSLLIFVVMRFGESQEEVRNNAAEVVKVTEEKRQLALAQQGILEKQVKERTEELSQSLDHLKSTQSQLIQAEKMASLGELTAGIAHEIQNPLNFVNNFSDVSKELLDEMKEELASGNQEEVLAIADDLIQNLDKIHHHGRRADGIVKGMLQHSRSSKGKRIATDINELADEYLRLAYHGLRAKDSTFNAAFETHFDVDLPKVEVIPQDMGRVLLNLINNAFQAVHEKRKSSADGYAPKVEVSTSQKTDHIQIVVKDNGSGIPDDIKDKIFQPFFTTKPTGQGTGLGLSLSYDIVKAHEGELKCVSIPGNGTEFIITLKL